MSRRRNRGDEPTLFDLPLDGPVEQGDAEPRPEPPEQAETEPEAEAESRPPRRTTRPEATPGDAADAAPTSAPVPPEERLRLPFEPAAPPPRAPEVHEPTAPARVTSGRPVPPEETFAEPVEPLREPPPTAPVAASLSVRYLAGLADLAVHAALAIALLFGARLLGVRADLGDWLPITLFLLVFSFFYTVLPLAFWGQTPGMAWAGVVARATNGESLTFSQTAFRWLGSLVTVALAGLPVLLALGGRRSLTDRLSDAETVLAD